MIASSRFAATRSLQQFAARNRSAIRCKSSGPSPLAPDDYISHSFQHVTHLGLAIGFPLYFLTPDSVTAGSIDRIVGLALSAGFGFHAWMGLNYTVADYVPQINKAMLMPARAACAGVAGLVFLGLARISMGSPGGIKGIVKGVWNPKEKEEEKA